MDKSYKSAMLALLVLILLSTPGQTKVKHVIVMIADGWCYNQIAATDYWFGKQQVYERFPLAMAMSTYSQSTLDEQEEGYQPELIWKDFDYAKMKPTDSAAAATAMSCGIKAKNGDLGVDPDKNPGRNIIEHAEELGLSTGVVSTVMFTHATPAGFVTHDESRNHYAEIAVEMIDSSACEVMIGCGHPLFDKNGESVSEDDAEYRYVGGQKSWQALQKGTAGGDCDGDGIVDPWLLIQTKAEFERYTTGDTPKRLLGLPQVAKTLQYERSGQASRNSPEPPFTTDPIPNVPNLEDLAQVALNVLDRNPQGFFLMIEGGAVDWACHNNLLGRMIEEMDDFNLAVEAVVSWVEHNSNWDESLLIVTGDHDCGYLLGSESGDSEEGDDHFYDVGDHGPGQMPDFKFFSGTHTNSLVPFFAKGGRVDIFVEFADQVDQRRGKFLDNTELAKGVVSVLKGN